MKRDHLLLPALNTVLAAVMGFAGAACLATAFRMEVRLLPIALTALLFAALTALFSRLRGGKWLLALTVLCSILYLWKLDFLPNVFTALHRILTLYDQGYGWGVPSFLTDFEAEDLTLTLQALAALGAGLAVLCLQASFTTGAALAIVLPVLPCIVLADTVPAAPWLLLAIGAVALLALTSHARRQQPHQVPRLTALLLIPLLLAGCLLGQRIPQAGFTLPDMTTQLFALTDRLVEHLPFMEGPSVDVLLPPAVAVNTIDLGDVGPQSVNRQRVLEVVASQTGSLYLRGRSYAVYTGLRWETYGEIDYLSPPREDYCISQVQTIQIQALQAQTVTYCPYYATDTLLLANGTLQGPVQSTYSYRYQPLQFDWLRQWTLQYATLSPDNSSYAQLQTYLQLPEDTAAAAQAHLEKAGVTDRSTIVQILSRIRSYVTSSAKYDIKTSQIPRDEPDFALWFLEDSETGYCMHFATAATVLLRAAGIPARYVEGYMVDVRAGQITQVQGRNAHAWVEYYMPHVGWVILEATPGFEQAQPQPTEPTQPPTTLPPQTTTPPTTEPTDPTRPSSSTRPTLPPVTAGPTQPTAPNPSTGPVGNTETPRFDWRPVLRVLHILGCLLAICAAVTGQWRLRLYIRRRRMAGREFIHVKRRWRYSCLLARLCRHKPPKPLLALLKKAKFSRDGLSKRELRQFRRYQAACIRGLQQCPWYVRLLLRLVLAAW